MSCLFLIPNFMDHLYNEINASSSSFGSYERLKHLFMNLIKVHEVIEIIKLNTLHVVVAKTFKFTLHQKAFHSFTFDRFLI